MNNAERLYWTIAEYNSVAIMGIVKNAGKTTVLNALIKELWKNGASPALSSIGRDGEENDIVTRTKKPKIYVYSGTIFATAKNLLSQCDVTRELLYSTGMNTPLGEIVICRALSGGCVQLGGSSINSQLKRLKELFMALGAEKIIIDGAFGRRSLSSPALCDCCILCTGAAFSRSMERTLEETGFIAGLFGLSAISGKGAAILEQRAPDENLIFINEDYSFSARRTGTNLASSDMITEGIDAETKYVFIGGALTDGAIEAVISSGVRGVIIAAEDASKILISKSKYEKLRLMKNDIVLLNTTRLAAICVNPFSPEGFDYDAEEFTLKMNGAVSVPVYNVLGGIL